MLAYNISQSTLWVVGIFLFITLMVGLYAGRGIKDIKDYALGGKRFSTFTLTLTLLATYISGSATSGTVKEIYSVGIIVIVAYFGYIIQHLIFAFIISPKIVLFKNCLTIGDLAKQLYGKNMQIFTGFLTLFYGLFVTTIQFFLIGKLFYSFFGIKVSYGIIIGGVILSIYSALGGIKAVTITDVLQFIVLIIVFPLIATLLLKKIGGYKELFMNIPKEKLLILGNKKFYYYLSFFIICSVFPGMLTNPPVMQRVFMTMNKGQLQKKFLVASIFDPVFRIIIMIIGFSALILFPNINNYEVFPYIIKNILQGGVIKGLAISGLLAVLMSSADSYIHSSGLLFTHDLLKPIFNNFKKPLNELLFSKISTIIIGIFAIILAIEVNKGLNLRSISLLTVKVTSPILLFPLLAGILGLKTNKQSLIFGILAGFISFIFSEYYFIPSMKMLSIPMGIIVNGIVYMVIHILQNKGIAWVKITENKQGEQKKESKLWIPNPEKILNTIINSIPTPKKIYAYFRFQVMKNGSENMIFGIYCCINFTLPYFLWDHQDTDKFNLMTNLRFVGGIMAGLLIVKDQWKDFLKPYYPLYWHITLTYCLPFITTIMFLLTGGSLSWLMNVGTSIFFLIMLVAGEVFLILAPLGIGLGIIFYKYFVGPINLSSLGFDINYFLFYQVFFSTVIGLLFAYRKQVSNVITGNIGLNLGESMCHELRNTLYSLSCNQYNRMRMNPIIDQGTKKIEGQESYVLSKSLFESLLKETNNAIDFDTDTIKVIATFEKIFKDYKKSLTNPGVYSMKSTIEYTLEELHFLPGQKERIETNLTDDFYAKIPKELFAFVISNIIRNSFKHGGPKKVNLKLENHKLIISDDGKGIPSSDLEKVFKMHYTTGKKGDSTGIGLGFSKIVVNSFQGDIWCESEEGENSYTEFHIKFPEVDPSEITTKTLESVNEEGINKGERTQREKIAIRMLKAEKPIKEIEEYTDLTRSEIEEIKKKL